MEWKSILRILKYLKKISINTKENLDFSSRMWYNNVYRNEARVSFKKPDQSKLKNRRMKYNLSLFCEIDKYAEQSYCAIHGADESQNVGDITKVDETKVSDFNVMFGGSPCTDFSIAGKQEGAMWTCNSCSHSYNPLEAHYTTRNHCPECGSTNITKTRSSLIVEWLRFLREKKPRFAIYENVKNLAGGEIQTDLRSLLERT